MCPPVRTIQRSCLALTLAVGLGSDAGNAAPAEVTTYSPSRICWQELEYKASKLGIEAESDISIRLVPTPEVEETLIQAPDCDEGEAVSPTGEQIAEVVIETRVRGTESVSTLLLDPATAAAYQRSQVSRSKKRDHTFLRTYRYLDGGVFIERRFPDGDPTVSAWEWPVNNTRTIAFADEARGEEVTEAMALFYILSAADLEAVGDSLRFVNFERDGMTEIVMTVEEMVPWDVSYTEVSPSGERLIEDRREVARLTLTGRSMGETSGSFEFLGLHGEIEIFADPRLRIPVAVRGKVPIFGKETVDVDRVVTACSESEGTSRMSRLGGPSPRSTSGEEPRAAAN